jgi:hypothetical protein
VLCHYIIWYPVVWKVRSKLWIQKLQILELVCI